MTGNAIPHARSTAGTNRTAGSSSTSSVGSTADVGGTSSAGGTGGRHRLGTTGLRHCRDIDTVRDRLGARRSMRRAVRQRDPARSGHWLTAVGVGMVAGVLTVSGWFTAVGATAVAQMITP